MYRLCPRHRCRTVSNLVTAWKSRLSFKDSSEEFIQYIRCAVTSSARCGAAATLSKQGQSRPSIPLKKKILCLPSTSMGLQQTLCLLPHQLVTISTTPAVFGRCCHPSDPSDDSWKPHPEKPPAVRWQHGTPKPGQQIHRANEDVEGILCILGKPVNKSPS